MNYLVEMWHNVLIGQETNWGFFVELNAGWLEMEYNHRYGNQSSEKDHWEWMFMNSENIKLSAEDYDCLAKQLNL